MPRVISNKHWILCFRTGFLVTLIAVSFLALTPLQIQAIEGSWDKRHHLAAFITLAFLLDYAIAGYWPKWLGLFCYGILIEIAQWFTEYRYFELSDILADGIGITLYVLLRSQLSRLHWLHTLRKTLDNPLKDTTE